MEKNRIKELRKLRKITQVELAKACNTSQGSIQKLENGAIDLDIQWMRKLAKVLGCKPYELLPLDMQPEGISPEELEILRILRKSKANNNPPTPAKAE